MQIVVWHNEKKNNYYYKIVNDVSYARYYTGYRNQYNHEVILVIKNIYQYKTSISIKKRLITKVISFLEKINK